MVVIVVLVVIVYIIAAVVVVVVDDMMLCFCASCLSNHYLFQIFNIFCYLTFQKFLMLARVMFACRLFLCGFAGVFFCKFLVDINQNLTVVSAICGFIVDNYANI